MISKEKKPRSADLAGGSTKLQEITQFGPKKFRNCKKKPALTLENALIL